MYDDYLNRGDRAFGAAHDLLQFNADAFLKNVSGGFVKVGHWAEDGISSSIYQLCDGISPSLGPQEACPYSVVYNTLDNSRTTDRPPPIVVQVDHSSALFAFGAVMAMIVVLAAGLIIVYQKESVVRTAQPTIMLLITLGEFIGALRVILTGVDLSTPVCIAQEVLGHLAFWLVFAPFILRTWRVNRVMNNTALSRVKVTLQDILRYAACIYVVMVIYLIISVAIENPHAGYYDETVNNQLYRYTTCNHSMIVLSYPLLGFEAVALCYCLWLAYAAKDLPQAFNEFYEAILSAMGISVIAVVMFFEQTIMSYPTSYRFSVGLAFGLGVFLTLSLMVLYKILLTMRGFKVSSRYEVKIFVDGQDRKLSDFGSGSAKEANFDETDPFVKDCLTELRRSHNDEARFQFILSRIAFLRNLLMMTNEGYFIFGRNSSKGSGGAARSSKILPFTRERGSAYVMK